MSTLALLLSPYDDEGVWKAFENTDLYHSSSDDDEGDDTNLDTPPPPEPICALCESAVSSEHLLDVSHITSLYPSRSGGDTLEVCSECHIKALARSDPDHYRYQTLQEAYTYDVHYPILVKGAVEYGGLVKARTLQLYYRMQAYEYYIGWDNPKLTEEQLILNEYIIMED